jgi:flagellar protein FliS
MEGKLSTYRKVETLGKSQLDLIIQVYDGTLAAFRAAANFYKSDDHQAGYQQLQKAKRFVTHLYTTLDPETGGEIAENLGKLYAFIINQTNVAEATKDLSVIDDNISILDNVRLGWLELKQQKTDTATKAPHPAADTEKFTESA